MKINRRITKHIILLIKIMFMIVSYSSLVLVQQNIVDKLNGLVWTNLSTIAACIVGLYVITKNIFSFLRRKNHLNNLIDNREIDISIDFCFAFISLTISAIFMSSNIINKEWLSLVGYLTTPIVLVLINIQTPLKAILKTIQDKYFFAIMFIGNFLLIIVVVFIEFCYTIASATLNSHKLFIIIPLSIALMLVNCFILLIHKVSFKKINNRELQIILITNVSVRLLYLLLWLFICLLFIVQFGNSLEDCAIAVFPLCMSIPYLLGISLSWIILKNKRVHK